MKTTETTWKTLALCSVSALAGMAFIIACDRGPGDSSAQSQGSGAVAYFLYSDTNGDGVITDEEDETNVAITLGDLHKNLNGQACPMGWTYLGTGDGGLAVCHLP